MPVPLDAAAGPRVVIEAAGGGEPPAGLPCEPAAPGTLRVSVPAAESDAVLRRLLTAVPPWHIRSVRPVQQPTEPS